MRSSRGYSPSYGWDVCAFSSACLVAVFLEQVFSPGKSGSYLSLGQYPSFKLTPFCTSCAQWHRYVIFTSVARYDFRHCGLILEQTPFEVLRSVRCPVCCHVVVLSAWSCLRHVWVTWPSFGLFIKSSNAYLFLVIYLIIHSFLVHGTECLAGSGGVSRVLV